MKLSILPTVLLIALGGCATTDQTTTGIPPVHDQGPSTAGNPAAASGEKAAEEKAKDPKEAQKKVAELEHKLQVAQIKVSVANLSTDGADLELREKRDHATKALAAAQANLNFFNNIDAPNRTGRAELSLQGALNSAAEAQEELEQLALMYDEQDLEDMTREFVIQRGKRRAERAKKLIEFSTLDLRGLIEHKLKQEREGLEGAVLKAEQALQGIDRDAQQNKLNNSLKLSEANFALEKAQEALEQAQTELAAGAQA